jgi:hypothetical protein
MSARRSEQIRAPPQIRPQSVGSFYSANPKNARENGLRHSPSLSMLLEYVASVKKCKSRSSRGQANIFLGVTAARISLHLLSALHPERAPPTIPLYGNGVVMFAIAISLTPAQAVQRGAPQGKRSCPARASG